MGSNGSQSLNSELRVGMRNRAFLALFKLTRVGSGCEGRDIPSEAAVEIDLLTGSGLLAPRLALHLSAAFTDPAGNTTVVWIASARSTEVFRSCRRIPRVEVSYPEVEVGSKPWIWSRHSMS